VTFDSSIDKRCDVTPTVSPEYLSEIPESRDIETPTEITKSAKAPPFHTARSTIAAVAGR